MRTTIDIPDELHRITMAIARDHGASFSATVARLLQLALGAGGTAAVVPAERTGMEVLRLGRTITAADVRALDDDP